MNRIAYCGIQNDVLCSQRDRDLAVQHFLIMDGKDSVASTSAGIDPAAAVGADRDTGGVTVDYSPDDEDLDEAAAAAAAEATRDTLADGLMTRLLRPCVDRLDASVQCTR